MWEFMKNIFSVYIAIGIFILNFIVSAGILKFYFDKKLAVQKEESDKKIAELNGQIERGNYIHKAQFEKEFEIYTELSESLYSLMLYRAQMKNFLKFELEEPDKIDEHKRIYFKIHQYCLDLVKIGNAYSPFFPSNIRKEILELHTKMLKYNNLCTNFFLKKEFDETTYNYTDNETNISYTNLEQLIRIRIESLKIIE